MYTSIYRYMYMYIYIYMLTCMYIYIPTYIYIVIYIYAYIYTYIYIYMYMYIVLYAIRLKYALLTCDWTLQQHCPIVWNSVHYIQAIPCIISLIWMELCHPSLGIVAVRLCICVLLNVSVYSCMDGCVCACAHARAYVWPHVTSPKFAKSRNLNSLVSCGTDSSRDIGSIWICTVQIDGLVQFEFVLRNAVSRFGIFWGCSISSGSCSTKTHICICTRNFCVFMFVCINMCVRVYQHVCACVSTCVCVCININTGHCISAHHASRQYNWPAAAVPLRGGVAPRQFQRRTAVVWHGGDRQFCGACQGSKRGHVEAACAPRWDSCACMEHAQWQEWFWASRQGLLTEGARGRGRERESGREGSKELQREVENSQLENATRTRTHTPCTSAHTCTSSPSQLTWDESTSIRSYLFHIFNHPYMYVIALSVSTRIITSSNTHLYTDKFVCVCVDAWGLHIYIYVYLYILFPV